MRMESNTTGDGATRYEATSCAAWFRSGFYRYNALVAWNLLSTKEAVPSSGTTAQVNACPPASPYITMNTGCTGERGGMKNALFLLVAFSGLVQGDFFDDFQSYQPGQGPESSGNWVREENGGYVLVTAQGENQVVEAFFPDSTYLGYLCTAAGFWADGSVSMDFSPDGTGSLVNVLARMQITTGEAYVGGVIVFLQPFTYAYIGYVNVAGDYELLYSDFGPTITPGTWVSVGLTAENIDPVTLTLHINGQQAAQVLDQTYLLGSGLSGFAMLFEGGMPSILADDFQVVLTPQGLETMTFGAIKAVFR